jgi:hypothetical protein
LTGQCKFDGNLFCFFLPPAKKEEGTPTHIAAHLQATRANAQKPKFAKELQFCLHTRAKLLLLSF